MRFDPRRSFRSQLPPAMYAGNPPAADHVLDVAKPFGGERHQAAGRDKAGLAVGQRHARPLGAAGSRFAVRRLRSRAGGRNAGRACRSPAASGCGRGAHRRSRRRADRPSRCRRCRSCRAAWRTRRCRSPGRAGAQITPGRDSSGSAAVSAANAASASQPVPLRLLECDRGGEIVHRGLARIEALAEVAVPEEALRQHQRRQARHRCGSWRRRRAPRGTRRSLRRPKPPAA